GLALPVDPRRSDIPEHVPPRGRGIVDGPARRAMEALGRLLVPKQASHTPNGVPFEPAYKVHGSRDRVPERLQHFLHRLRIMLCSPEPIRYVRAGTNALAV